MISGMKYAFKEPALRVEVSIRVFTNIMNKLWPG
ncbi:MAG: hypothetical protein BMS9Abin28_1678 [Anaerolineae bacterium]|nr:MAG: hypothetical protein BMS9Abin28_1678 [Anaerolineae bacterium]